MSYIRKAELLADLGIHASTLDDWVKQGKFPAPRVYNPGVKREIVGWEEDDVKQWKDSRPQRQAKPITEKAYKRGPKPPFMRRPKK